MALAPKKIVIAAVLALGLAVLGLVLLLFVEFDSPRLGRLALDQIGKAAGFELQAEGFRLNLLRGLELEQVAARGQVAGGQMTATMDRLVLKHRPADLLGGTLTVTEIVLDRPRLELDSTQAGSSPAPPPAEAVAAGGGEGDDAEAGGGTGLALAISSIRLEGGALVQRATDAGAVSTTQVTGLDVELADVAFGAPSGAPGTAHGSARIAEIVLAAEGAPPEEVTTVRGVEVELADLAFGEDPTDLAAATMHGELRVEEMISGVDRASDLASKMELGGGRFQLPDIEMTAPQGVLRGTLEAKVAADPIAYSLRLTGDELSTGVLLGLGEIRGLGSSALQVSVDGDSSDLARLVGDGQLTIGSGKLPDHPILAQIEALLGNVVLIGAGYDAFPLTFDIRQQRIHLARCELSVGPVGLAMNGWVGFEGPMEVELTVLTPREGLDVKEIPIEVLDALSEDDGRVNLPLLVSGTSEQSKVAFNRELLKQLGGRYVRKTVEREATKALLKLFEKDKDEDEDG